MTLQQFQATTQLAQLETINQWGHHIATLKNKEAIIQLFKVKTFYVQLHYERPYRQLQLINSFSSLDKAHPHFMKIVNINL